MLNEAKPALQASALVVLIPALCGALAVACGSTPDAPPTAQSADSLKTTAQHHVIKNVLRASDETTRTTGISTWVIRTNNARARQIAGYDAAGERIFAGSARPPEHGGTTEYQFDKHLLVVHLERGIVKSELDPRSTDRVSRLQADTGLIVGLR
jgi:hypothetical protein